jgi:hypothetical protein
MQSGALHAWPRCSVKVVCALCDLYGRKDGAWLNDGERPNGEEQEGEEFSSKDANYGELQNIREIFVAVFSGEIN